MRRAAVFERQRQVAGRDSRKALEARKSAVDARRVLAPIVARAIGGGKVMLLLDSCENIIDTVARWTDAMLRISPGV
jgi:hypothetical protein